MKHFSKIFIVTGLVTALIAIVIVLSAVSSPAHAAGPWYVGPGGSDGNDCLSPATRCATINGALAKPGFVADDTIRVEIGTYTGTGSEVVLLNKNATLSGGWDSTFTTQNGTSTIDGQGERRGITVNSSVSTTIERFAIQNGLSNQGGGLYNDGTLTLNNSSSSGNAVTSDGGGIFNNGTATLNNSAINNNTARQGGGQRGGGIYNGGSLKLNYSTINGNMTGANGGGIYNTTGAVTLINSTINGNTTEENGGGIYNINGAVTLTNSTISSNLAISPGPAGNGGGIYNAFGTLILNSSTVHSNTATSGTDEMAHGGGIYSDGPLTLNNSTISGNSALHGGGIFRWAGQTTLNNSTISGNRATWAFSGYGGGGIYNNSGDSLTLQNSILAENIGSNGPDCSGSSINSLGYNLIGNLTGCTFGSTTGDSINFIVKLGPLEGSPGYHPLLSGSPAINAGNPSGCTGSAGLLTTDQRGFPRFGRCDIGAYEMQPISFSSKTANKSTALPGDTLTYTVTLSNGGATPLTNVRVTDTLTNYLTYINNSLTAPSGTYGYSNGVISWAGSVNAGETINIAFGATVNPVTALAAPIVNSAVISGGGEIITRTATVNVGRRIYLPLAFHNFCSDFFDNFDNPASGWEVVNNDFVRTRYLNGEYQILGKKSGYFYLFPAPACPRQNFTFQADMRWVNGPPGSSYGLVFGTGSATQSFNRYYLFDITNSDIDYPRFRLLRRDESGFVTIVGPSYSLALKDGGASNRLRVTRNDNQITLEVNGMYLGTWSDSTISGLMRVGIVSNPHNPYPNSNPVSDARFDNFSVTALPNSSAASLLSGTAVEANDSQVPPISYDPVPAEMSWGQP